MVFHLFGDKLKELRKAKGLTQEELGKLFNVAKNTVSYWEANTSKPDIDLIVKLAQYFNVTTDYLLGFNQDDSDKIDRLNIALREAGMVNSDETLKEEEIKLAIDQARQYKIMLTKILDTPNKYPEGNEKKEQVNKKDTNK